MPRHRIATWLVLAVLTPWLACPPSPAQADNAPPRTRQAGAPAVPAADRLEFVRFSDDGKGGGTLDTAIATYQNADGVVVHLVAAVHIGERAYYSGLSDTFDTYDALLYELVKPKDGPVPGAEGPQRPGGAQIRGAAAIGGLQSILKNALKLEFQLESINYDRPNFIHADLDAETFNEMQAARGESLFRLMIRSMMHEMARQRDGKGGAAAPITLFDVLAAMRSPDSDRQFKLLLARQMKDLDAQLEGIEGKDGSVIISERNKAALRVLERTIGEGRKNLGVFYGAGHMRGLEDALLGRMNFKRTGVEWRVAWDMRTPAEGEAPQDDGKNGDRAAGGNDAVPPARED